MPTKRGPRTTGEDTRSQIIAAAQVEFAKVGYDHASLRAIARAAGVDPALVHHYFADKTELFHRCMQEMGHPLHIAERVMAESPDSAPAALLRYFLEEWDSPSGERRFLVTSRSIAQPEGQRQVQKYWRESIIEPIVRRFTDDQVALRATLLSAELIGLATMRHVMQAPAFTAMTAEQLSSLMAPCVRHYLMDPLGVTVS